MGLFNIFKKENEKVQIKENKQEASIQDDEDEVAAVIASVISCMDEEETVAAITAAISCILGTSTSSFIVRNIKRTPELDPIWAVAGRMKLMR